MTENKTAERVSEKLHVKVLSKSKEHWVVKDETWKGGLNGQVHTEKWEIFYFHWNLTGSSWIICFNNISEAEKWCRGFLLIVPSFSLHLSWILLIKSTPSLSILSSTLHHYSSHTQLKSNLCIRFYTISKPTHHSSISASPPLSVTAGEMCLWPTYIYSAVRVWRSVVDGCLLSILSGCVPAVSEDICYLGIIHQYFCHSTLWSRVRCLTIGWIAMKFRTDVHCSKRIHD